MGMKQEGANSSETVIVSNKPYSPTTQRLLIPPELK